MTNASPASACDDVGFERCWRWPRWSCARRSRRR